MLQIWPLLASPDHLQDIILNVLGLAYQSVTDRVSLRLANFEAKKLDKSFSESCDFNGSSQKMSKETDQTLEDKLVAK